MSTSHSRRELFGAVKRLWGFLVEMVRIYQSLVPHRVQNT